MPTRPSDLFLPNIEEAASQGGSLLAIGLEPRSYFWRVDASGFATTCLCRFEVREASSPDSIQTAPMFFGGQTKIVWDHVSRSSGLRRTTRSFLCLQRLASPSCHKKQLDSAEPSAALCLRILGSFQTEVGAKTRVLNLYHCVLPQKVCMHDVFVRQIG